MMYKVSALFFMLPLLDLHCGGAKGADGKDGTAADKKFYQFKIKNTTTDKEWQLDATTATNTDLECKSATGTLQTGDYIMCLKQKDATGEIISYFGKVHATMGTMNHKEYVDL